MSSEPNYICPICRSENHADESSSEIECEECGYEDDIDEFEKEDVCEGEHEDKDDSEKEDKEE